MSMKQLFFKRKNVEREGQALVNFQGGNWQAELQVTKKRQRCLAAWYASPPNINNGIYPFAGKRLSRADVIWLLLKYVGQAVTQTNTENYEHGLDLRGADLRGVDLHGLPLSCIIGGLSEDDLENEGAQEEQRKIAGIHLEEANLCNTNLTGAILDGAYLDGVHIDGGILRKASLQGASLRRSSLIGANLEQADMGNANLENADLRSISACGAKFLHASLDETYIGEARLCKANFHKASLRATDLQAADLEDANFGDAHLENADLRRANISRTDLRQAHLAGARLNDIKFGAEKKNIGPRIADTNWNEVNLTVISWSEMYVLHDEAIALQKDKHASLEDVEERLKQHEDAIRANRQLAAALLSQGMNEVASRFSYRAQVLQRRAWHLRLRLPGATLIRSGRTIAAWLGSWLLFLLAGYGYKPERSFFAYVLVILSFAICYFNLGRSVGILSFLGSLVFSMVSFHGRGFGPSTIKIAPDAPIAVLAALEAFIGLIIEVTFIAALTQRLFNK